MSREDWDDAYAAAELTGSIQPHPHLAEQLTGLPPGRAIELGCGEGREAIWLASRGWQVTAADFSQVAVDRGRQIAERHGVDVDWVVADVVDYNPPGPVDLVVVLYLHLPPGQLTTVLGKATVALAPGGTLFILGWDRQNHTDGTGGPRPPEVLYSTEDLVNAVDGLQVLRAEQIRQAGSTDAVDTLLTARRHARPEESAPSARSHQVVSKRRRGQAGP